jgi:hypothetical protein
MRTVLDIYREYRLMPILQEHQLRVAAVSKLLSAHIKTPHDAKSVLLACLFHDMGNIIKSDLGHFPESVKPEGRKYWEKVKKEYIEKYGTNEHAATIAVVQELKLSERVTALIDGIEFRNIEAIQRGADLEQKLCEYADMRAGPHGVLSIAERTEDGKKRHTGRGNIFDTDRYVHQSNALKNLEADIFSMTDITPRDISDTSIQGIMKKLRAFPVLI